MATVRVGSYWWDYKYLGKRFSPAKCGYVPEYEHRLRLYYVPLYSRSFLGGDIAFKITSNEECPFEIPEDVYIEKTEYYYKNRTKPYDIATQLLLRDKDFKSFRLWDSPERLVIATNTVTRALDGEIESYTPIDRIKVLWGSARLAYELPEASPRIVHNW